MRVQGKLHERESGGAQHGEHGKQAAVADGKPCPEEQQRQKRKPQKRRGRLEAEADGQKQRGGIRGHKIKKRGRSNKALPPFPARRNGTNFQ